MQIRSKETLCFKLCNANCAKWLFAGQVLKSLRHGSLCPILDVQRGKGDRMALVTAEPTSRRSTTLRYDHYHQVYYSNNLNWLDITEKKIIHFPAEQISDPSKLFIYTENTHR